jgi:hypothetical protein
VWSLLRNQKKKKKKKITTRQVKLKYRIQIKSTTESFCVGDVHSLHATEGVGQASPQTEGQG